MKVNSVSNAYSANYSKTSNVMKHNNSVSFQKAQILKGCQNAVKKPEKALVCATVALAALGIAPEAKAQDVPDNTTNTEVAANSVPPAVVDPLNDVHEYIATFGIAPEYRQAIADEAEEYSTKYHKQFMNACEQIYNDYDHFKKTDDCLGNPIVMIRPNYGMKKNYETADMLTKFRGDMILVGAIRNGSHYTPNPTLDPINDNKEAIEEVLGKPYEQYIQDNAETLTKLNALQTSEELAALTDGEKSVLTNMHKVNSIGSEYLSEKEDEYKEEATNGILKHVSNYSNDMDKLDKFRNAKNNTENINMHFDFYATGEGYNHAIVNWFYNEIYGNESMEHYNSLSKSERENISKNVFETVNNKINTLQDGINEIEDKYRDELFINSKNQIQVDIQPLYEANTNETDTSAIYNQIIGSQNNNYVTNILKFISNLIQNSSSPVELADKALEEIEEKYYKLSEMDHAIDRKMASYYDRSLGAIHPSAQMMPDVDSHVQKLGYENYDDFRNSLIINSNSTKSEQDAIGYALMLAKEHSDESTAVMDEALNKADNIRKSFDENYPTIVALEDTGFNEEGKEMFKNMTDDVLKRTFMANLFVDYVTPVDDTREGIDIGKKPEGLTYDLSGSVIRSGNKHGIVIENGRIVLYK